MCGYLVVTILVINFERVMFMFKTMTDGVLSIALTGHRPDKLAGYNLNNPFYGRLHERLMKIIERALDNYPLVECHSGMALGADTVWAEVIVECQEKYGRDRIRFIADIPDENQSSRWFNKADRDRWKELVGRADEVRQYAHHHVGKSYAYILNQRNIGMIQACDILIAIYNGDAKGGTANGVRDGVRMGKFITRIHPNSI